MVLSEERKRNYIRRLLLSRMRLLCEHGFYGLLLMHMTYALDPQLETAATDGSRICFGPEFLDSLSDPELDFVMMHEVLHVVLQHCARGKDQEQERFNIACDIVVNSNILLENKRNLTSITLQNWGESMHLAPNGKEGYLYTAEEVYAMLPPTPGKEKAPGGFGLWDDHSQWGEFVKDPTLQDVWVKRFQDAAQAISIRDPSNSRGLLPRFAQRILDALRKPQTDWRLILNDFIQEEVVDYSFCPPDRRFSEAPFFLPDFNGKEDMVADILFMIDTSASMSDEMVTAAYSEIKGAIDQFDGRLQGWLGFFDAGIIEPQPFMDEEEFRTIRPAGGGGTDFEVIFEYVRRFMQEHPPVSIVILTDGYAPFPPESAARGIPVLWLLNNQQVAPPWGKVARIQV